MEAPVTLYEIDEALLRLLVRIQEQEGVLDEDLERELDELDISFEKKIEGYIRRMKNLGGTAATIKEEEDRLKARRTALEKEVSGLKDRIQQSMTLRDLKKMEFDLFTVAIQKSGRPTIRWDGDEADLPEGLSRTTVSLNGTKALELWKAGELPEGFTVAISEHIRIR